MKAALIALAGAAGAAALFARYAWPASALRMRNAAAMLGVVVLSTAASLLIPRAWAFGAGWTAAAMLLQWSHAVTPAGRFVAVRAIAATVMVGVAAYLIETAQ